VYPDLLLKKHFLLLPMLETVQIYLYKLVNRFSNKSCDHIKVQVVLKMQCVLFTIKHECQPKLYRITIIVDQTACQEEEKERASCFLMFTRNLSDLQT